MPLGSEAADHEIVNGSVTEAESAGLSGPGADGVASAGAIPMRSAKPQKISNAGSRALNATPPLGLTAVYASLHVGRNRDVSVQSERAGLRLVAAARARARPDDVAAVRRAKDDRRSCGERCRAAAADGDVDAGWVRGDAFAASAGRRDGQRCGL